MIKTPFTTSTPIRSNESTQLQTNSNGDQEPQQLRKPETKSSLVRLGESNPQPCLTGDWARFFNVPNIDKKTTLFDLYLSENGATEEQRNTSISEFNKLAKLLTGRRSLIPNANHDDPNGTMQVVVKNMSHPVNESSGSEERTVPDEDEFEKHNNVKKKSKFETDESVDSNSSFEHGLNSTETSPSKGQCTDGAEDSICFQRKYHPTLLNETPEMVPNQANTISKVYESRVEKILRIMNTSNTEFSQHRIRVTQKPTSTNVNNLHQNYSFYALLFMIASNLFGLILSLTFQVLLFLKLNADRFLIHCWSHWQHASVLHRENNILTLIMMLPLILVVLVAYTSIWLAYNINRLLLTSVPDRLADVVSFNIHIVQ